MNIAIIDDEKSCRETLEHNLIKKCLFSGIINQADGVENGISLIESTNPDLVFLDVEMQDGTGFDLLSHFKKFNFQVIFVTAYDKYAIQAFRFSATDFLLKPIEPQLLLQTFEKIITNKRLDVLEQKINNLLENRDNPKKIGIPTSNGLVFVKLDDIIHIQAEDNYAKFILKNRKDIIVAKPLKEYDELLNQYRFFRTHKSHLVNLNYVEQYCNSDGGYIIMENKNRIAVSRRKKEQFLQQMNQL